MTRFIILIPTLNGAATLGSTLATCYAQDYKDVRIIVSDNWSEDATAEIVQSWKDRDGRIEYLRPPKRLSMSSHWEWAIRTLMDDDAYLIVLGCDDAIMPGALRYASELLSILPEAQCLAWHTNYYHYPDLSDPSMAGRMMLHLGRSIEVRETRTWLQRTAMGNVHYTALPNVYHGLTQMACLRTLAQDSAQMIRSLTPDMYLSLALCCTLEKYVFLNEPLSLNVISKASNGFSQSNPLSDRTIKTQFMKDNDRSFHRDLPLSEDIFMLHAECLLHVRDAGLLPKDVSIELRNILGQSAIHTYTCYAGTPLFEERQAQLEAIAEKYFLRSFIKDVSVAITQDNQAKLSSLVDRSWYSPAFDYVAKLDPALVTNAHAAAVFAGELVRSDERVRWQCLNSIGGLLTQSVDHQGHMPAEVVLRSYQHLVKNTVGELWINPAFLRCYVANVKSRPPAFDSSLYLKTLTDRELKVPVVATQAVHDKGATAAMPIVATTLDGQSHELPAGQIQVPVQTYKTGRDVPFEGVRTPGPSHSEGRSQTVSTEVRRLSLFLTDANCGDPRFVIPYRAGRYRYGWQGTFVSPYSTSVQGGSGCVWVVQRWPWILPEMLERAKAAGTRIIHDLDDLLWNIPDDNPNKVFFSDSKINMLLTLLTRADCATVSTDVLAEELACKGIPARVLPNCLAPEQWAHLRPTRRVGKRPRIGWAGQRTVHAADLELLREVMATLAHEVEWVFLGDTPPFAQTMGVHVENHPMVPIRDYPSQLAALNLDLALAPLAMNRFNEAKSDIRLLHYGALGYPVVATDIVPHRQAPVKLVPNVAAAWVEAIRERVFDLDAAAREGERLREWVFATRSIDVWVPKYAAAWFGRDGDDKETVVEVDRHVAVSQVPTFLCSIIMPVHNNVELTRQSLTALAKVTDGCEYEVIVVDNHSTDGTQEFLSSLGGDVQIIRNAENRGFSKACNQGAKAARGRYLVFLNNDTIPQTGWLEPLVREVEQDRDVAVVGSKLLYGDGTIQHAGVVFSRTGGIPYHLYRRLPGDASAVNRRCEFQCVTAACMLVRRESFEKVGGFDEAYRNGFEDVDMCLKIREQGQRIVYQPRSVVIHLEEQTPGRKAHDAENMRLFVSRWGKNWWLADEDLHYHADGYKLVGSEGTGESVGKVQLIEGIRDRAAWSHVAATQAAVQKNDWTGVKRELGLVQDWPSDPSVLGWAAMVCEKLDEPALRHTFLTRYLELNDSPTVRLSLVRSLLAHKSLAAAEQQLNTLLARSPDDPDGLLLRGLLCMQREQYREAETAFSTAIRQGADRKKCLMGMGMASLGRAYAQGAWERFLDVLSDNPDDAEAIHWLLRAGTAQNRWDDLTRHLREFLLRNPRDLAVRLALAGVLLRADQIEAARQEHDMLRAAAPTYDGLAALEEAIVRKEAVLAMAGSSVVDGEESTQFTAQHEST